MFSSMNGALLSLISRFRREDGQSRTEYIVLFAIIALVCIAVLTLLGLAFSLS